MRDYGHCHRVRPELNYVKSLDTSTFEVITKFDFASFDKTNKSSCVGQLWQRGNDWSFLECHYYIITYTVQTRSGPKN